MASGRLIIVGGGGFGRELLCWAADCNAAGMTPPLAGVIDDDSAVLDGYAYAAGRIGGISDFQPADGDQLVIAIGDPATKRKVTGQLRDRGARFATLIHPTAVIAHSAKLGEGVVFCPLSMVSADANVGQLVIVNTLSSVGHDVVVGDYSTLSAHVDLTGFVRLGDEVMVGSGARLVPNIKVGDRATIGAGATVYRSVPAGATVYTTPAKTMKA